MNISIRNTDALNSMIRKNQIKWELYAKSYKSYIFKIMAIGGMLLIIGMTNQYTFRFYPSANGPTYNLNIAYSLALTCFLIALFYFRALLRTKKKYFAEADRYIGMHSLDPDDGLMNINEKGVAVDGNLFKAYWDWKLFMHYQLYKGSLVLLMDDSYLSTAIVIDASKLAREDYNQLISFIKTRLSVKV